MILIQWLKFLFLIFSFLSTNQIFLTMHFNLRFRISYLRSSYDNLKNILSSSSFLFFPSSFSFSFHLFPHFPFVLLSFPIFLFFFFFSQFALFPQFGLPFPKSAAPVLPHFLLPCFRPMLIFPLFFFGNDCICLSCLKKDKRNTRIHVLPDSRFSHNPVDLKVHGLIFCFI